MTTYAATSSSSSVAASDAGDSMPRPRHAQGAGKASRTSSVINLVNTIVGAGTLAMPAVMANMGVTLGVTLIVWSGLTAAFGLYLQSRCARYLEPGKSSFFALSQLTYPNAAILFDAAIAVKCFGVGVSYMIIVGDLMPGISIGFAPWLPDNHWTQDRQMWINIFMAPILFLALLKRLDSLKYTSFVAIFAIAYLIVLVVVHCFIDDTSERGPVRLVEWAGPVEALKTLPVVVFAYTCHQNMFAILNEIQDNSPGSLVSVIGTSIGSSSFTYILVAVTGYLTFGNSVSSNIVSMYVPSFVSTIAKAAIVVLVTTAIPLQIHPCRASINAVLKWRPKGRQNNRHNSPASSPGSLPLLPSSSNESQRPVSDAGTMSNLRFGSITAVILVASYMTARYVTNLDTMLAFVGSLGSTSISFILPGIFYYNISDPEGIHHQRLSKESDDIDDVAAPGWDPDHEAEEAGLAASTASLKSLVSTAGASLVPFWRSWRWDLEHLHPNLLRKMALGLVFYGVTVMVVCLTVNIWFRVIH